jgi:hypothetical protein
MQTRLPKWVLPAGSLAGMLGIGIAIGRLGHAPGGDSLGGNDSPSPSHARHSGTGSQEGSTTLGNARTQAGGSPRPASRHAAILDINSVLAIASAPERTKRLLNHLDKLSNEELAALYETSRHNPALTARSDALALMLQSWVERNPPEALDYLQRDVSTNDWERETAINAWAVKDPQAAMDWAFATPDAGQRNNWQIGALEGIAAIDLPLAKTYRSELAGKQHPQTAETLRWVERIIQRYDAATAVK